MGSYPDATFDAANVSFIKRFTLLPLWFWQHFHPQATVRVTHVELIVGFEVAKCVDIHSPAGNKTALALV